MCGLILIKFFSTLSMELKFISKRIKDEKFFYFNPQTLPFVQIVAIFIKYIHFVLYIMKSRVFWDYGTMIAPLFYAYRTFFFSVLLSPLSTLNKKQFSLASFSFFLLYEAYEKNIIFKCH